MKLSILRTGVLVAAASLNIASAQNAESYTNYIWQTQMKQDGSVGIQQILPDLANRGTEDSPLILGGAQNTETGEYEFSGAKFELFTMHASGKEYKLAQTYVDTYTAQGKIELFSEDPYTPPRTRADKGFSAVITLGNLSDSTDRNAAAGEKAVQYRRYVQAYAENDNGANNDPNQATLKSNRELTKADVDALTKAAKVNFDFSAVPGDLIKRRGEERHEIWSVEDYGKPSYKLASATIQVWPKPTGAFSGLTDGKTYRYLLPEVEVTYDDVYPNSTVMARIYKGPYKDAEPGANEVYFIQGSSINHNEPTPKDYTLKLPKNWADNFPEDGEWTIELVARTPFERDGEPPLLLDHHTFRLDRKMKVNSAISTSE